MSNWDDLYKNGYADFEGDFGKEYEYVKSDVLVSIICMTYNHEKYVEQALKGLVSQRTNFKYEIIVHDDASTDNTAEIIRKYASMYPDLIQPIIQEENKMSKGVKITRDIIFPVCKGKYIAFCEGDDYWCFDDRLQKQVEAMENSPNISMCLAKVQYMDAEGNKLDDIMPRQCHNFKEGIIPKDYYCEKVWIYGAYFHTSSYLMRRDLILWSFKSKATLRMNGDQVWLRIASMLGDVYFLNEIVACRRMLTSNSFNKWFADAKDDVKAKYLLNEAEGYAIFDSETNREFHKYSVIAIYRKLEFGIPYDEKRVKAIAKLSNAKLCDFRPYGTAKDKALYLLIKYLTGPFHRIMAIKRRHK